MIKIIANDNKIDSIMGTIKDIDKDRNGYVTHSELDDIMKMNYPKELSSRDVLPIIKKFSSVQNKILIDYKGFRDMLRLEVNKYQA